jgi:hypothetical protein
LSDKDTAQLLQAKLPTYQQKILNVLKFSLDYIEKQLKGHPYFDAW